MYMLKLKSLAFISEFLIMSDAKEKYSDTLLHYYCYTYQSLFPI